MSQFDLDGFLPYRLAVIASRISRDFSRQYQQEFGITIPEWRVVAHLSQVQKTSIREICKKVEMDKSKTSRAAARLVERGYVTRKTNRADRRLIELSLTEKGRAMVAEIARMGARFQAEFEARISPADRPGFLGAIEHLMETTK